MRIAEFLALLTDAKPHGACWMAKCPGHDDSTASLQVKEGDDGRILLKCFGHCDTEHVLDSLGLTFKELFADTAASKSEARIVATYDFVDAAGVMLYQEVKYRPKDFKLRRLADPPASPVGVGDGLAWIWNLEGVTPVLYRLPELMASLRSRDEIWVVEGPKDADCCRDKGLAATTCSGGAGKWTNEMVELLTGANVTIVRDRDYTGANAAKFLAFRLAKVCNRVRVVEAQRGKDAFDHFAAGLGESDFLEVQANDLNGFTRAKLPIIEVENRELRDITDDAFRAIIEANRKADRIFSMGGNMLAKVHENNEGGWSIMPLVGDALLGVLQRAANWVKTTKTPPKGAGDLWSVRRKTVFVPPQIRADFPHLAPFHGLRRLDGIARCPVMDGWNLVHNKPGYSVGAKMWIDVPDGIEAAGCSAEESAQWIFDEVLCDFPFADDASRAHALALMLLPIVRPAIDGAVPLMLIDAPTQGSGKGLLGRVCLLPGCGVVAATNAPKDPNEWAKTLTLLLRDGVPYLFLDNISTRVDSDELNTMLTEKRYSGRIIGTSVMINVPLRMVMVGTSNNARLSTDIMRRTLYIRLDPQTERPQDRTGFKHASLGAWAEENRWLIMSRLLDIVNGWRFAGAPSGSVQWGSFERYAHLMSGILENAGVTGFMANFSELSDVLDEATNNARRFVSIWLEKLGTEPQTARQLRNAIHDEDPEFCSEYLTGDSPETQAKALGYKLRSLRDRTLTALTDTGEIATKIVIYTRSKHGSRFKLNILSEIGVDGVDDSNATRKKNLFEEEHFNCVVGPSEVSAPSTHTDSDLGSKPPETAVQMGDVSTPNAVWEDL